MTGSRNVAEHIAQRAAESPARQALVLPGAAGGRAEDGAEPETVSYGELDRAAAGLAAELAERGARGRRVLLLPSSRRHFAVGLLACLYAGAVAVPASWPGGSPRRAERITAIVADAAPHLVLTGAADAAEASQLLAAAGHGRVPCLPAEAVPAATTVPAGTGPRTLPDLPPETTALLQYTSGSTRAPRAAVLTHGNLMANQRAIARALGTRPGVRAGGWLPLHHDMGLIGQLLHPLWQGGTAVLLRPADFARRPAEWLEAVGRHRIAVSAAPDAAYERCVRQVTDEQLAGLDLSGWEVAVSGGEPVRAQTLRSFAERFASAGLRPEALVPCYGLAEATLLVSGAAAPGGHRSRRAEPAALERRELRAADDGRPARPLVSCGPVAEGTEVRIVVPETGEALAEGRIGEIWIRGPGVAQGYWNRTGLAGEDFRGRTPGSGPGFLRTGDLGTLAGGELYVTGRTKDLIALAGRKLYPQDVEHSVQAVSGLFLAGSAFGVETAGREELVVVQEVRTRRRHDADLAGLTARVRERVAGEFGVEAGGVLLVRQGTVRRTTSGKVQRTAMRRLFLAGELFPLHEDLTPDLRTAVHAGQAGRGQAHGEAGPEEPRRPRTPPPGR